MQSSPSAEAAVVLAGLDMAHRGPDGRGVRALEMRAERAWA